MFTHMWLIFMVNVGKYMVHIFVGVFIDQKKTPENTEVKPAPFAPSHGNLFEISVKSVSV